MIKLTSLRLATIVFCCLWCSTILGQTKAQQRDIIANYDLQTLDQLEKKLHQKYTNQKAAAERMARLKQWPIRYTEKGVTYELMKVSEAGDPIYYRTMNVDAGISTRVNHLHNGGSLGLNLEGQGVTAHVWDAGIARATHQEYDGAGGTDRYSVGDATTALHAHAAHVTGTIISSGVVANAKGMAPQSTAVGYNWGNDMAEVIAAAANGMLISNHSYGYGANGIPDWFFGAYIAESRDWDQILYNAPYYLMVLAAGNDGLNTTANGAPLNANPEYDKLSGHATAKNNMIVANGEDAVINGDGSLNSVTRYDGSSEGPTDDLRIKPEVMGNGHELNSTLESGDTAYNSFTGTSMASPNVCGSLLLLQQHHSNLHNSYMRAATLKGLTMHTADDVHPGNTNNAQTIALTGPDATTGWGLVNTKAAAEALSNNGLQSWISEEHLKQGETFTMTVQSDGINPLLASISWTDPAGTANTGTPNDPTAALVNDLDIRITQGGTTHNPWRLTGVDTNGTGDNTVDPFERVDVTGATGTYTITVTHKGTLTNASQRFSLVVTGISSSIALIKKTPKLTVCSNNDAVFNFDYKQIGGGTTNLSATDVPTGATLNFSQNSISADGSFSVTLSNLTNVATGSYEIKITANNGSETETRTIHLQIYHSTFSPITLQQPTNGSVTGGTTNLLQWTADANAEEYVFQMATNPNFNTPITNATISETQYLVSGLTQGQVYYWRVFGKNRCATATEAEIRSFQVGSPSCNTVTETTDVPIADLTTVTSTINVPNAVTISDVNVRVDYTHSWIGDAALTLVSPAGTRVSLINIVTCTTQTNFNLLFDDDAINPINCAIANANYPNISTYKPVSPLNTFHGETANGVWTLEIRDGGPGDTGTMNEWALEICSATQFGTVPGFTNNGLNVDVNSNYTVLTSDIEASTPSETAAQQIYTVISTPTRGNLRKGTTTMVIGDTFNQDEINTGVINYINTESNAFTDEFKVDISNTTSGWLPNQTVPINGTLGITSETLASFALWPNPAKNIIHYSINLNERARMQFQLIDLQGRIVYRYEEQISAGNYLGKVVLPQVEEGIYLLNMKFNDKQINKQLMIQQ